MIKLKDMINEKYDSFSGGSYSIDKIERKLNDKYDKAVRKLRFDVANEESTQITGHDVSFMSDRGKQVSGKCYHAEWFYANGKDGGFKLGVYIDTKRSKLYVVKKGTSIKVGPYTGF